ncbi:MAG: hypothetical protein H0T68_14385 [Gemmatimonadales bacterium]|nr:hypothetical protein [Gemmatimonadales bacterium]
MKASTVARCALGAVTALLFACGEGPTDPASQRPGLAITGTDPAPSAPGIFLGTAVSGTACANGSQADTDQDGLADVCENALAAAFAPQLAYAASDRTGREPRWAARPLGAGKVRIAYLLSLYSDDGTYRCSLGRILCGGHYGDSETIVLDVSYNGTSRHWVLHLAIFSAHGVYNVYPRFFSAYPSMNFPDKKGGYPKAFVALRKHALYRSDTECDDGELGLDECKADTYQRIAAGRALGIGSRGRHTEAQDCVQSTVFPSSTVRECYWTVREFGGWQAKSPKAGAYSSILGFFGF